MAFSGGHIPPSPEYVAAFVHATALSMRQLLNDMQTYWGPREYVEYHNAIRAKLSATPKDGELSRFCHDIQLSWDNARQATMVESRFEEL